jgi:hypothetical protein
MVHLDGAADNVPWERMAVVRVGWLRHSTHWSYFGSPPEPFTVAGKRFGARASGSDQKSETRESRETIKPNAENA